ncbi:MAG: trypsin-like peptidase domain-containing protein [Oscillospiraceae bacterium]|nr:trypsin-like peptidase domain-containing protein [Oscillospiraceae bacterium]
MTEPFENQNEQSTWAEPKNEQSAWSEPKNEQPTWEQRPNYYYKPPKKEKSGWPAGLVIAVTLVCSLLAGAFGAGGMYLATTFMDDATPSTNGTKPTTSGSSQSTTILEGDRENVVIDITKIDTSKVMTQAEVYAANVNSTVGITTSITTNLWGYQTTSAASGSGFVFSKDGYILTNYHVVDDSTSITVSMYDGTTYDAKLVGYDESNDVAVLKVEATDLVPVVLGNSDNLNVGDSVVAIGNPLGELTFSLTAGSISAKDRDITMSNGSSMQLIQTDCAINSGNSGGALFNLYGEVVGITNAKYSSSSSSSTASIDNIGFAIPINKARSIAESIIEKGYVSKPYVGVSVATVSEETQMYGLPQGASVQQIVENSPAAEAGLQINDIITHVNGNEIASSNDMVAAVRNAAIGDELKLTVYRMGKTVEVTVTVGEQKTSVQEQEQTQNQNQGQSQRPQFPFGY